MRQIPILFIRILTLAAFLTPGYAHQISQVYHFSEPSISYTGNDYQLVRFPQDYLAGIPGQPTLPFQPVAIYVPPSEKIIKTKINYSGKHKINQKILLQPYQRPQNSFSGSNSVIINEDIYSQQKAIQKPDLNIQTHFFHGHPVALGCFTPIEYNPGTQTLYYYENVEIEITTEAAGLSENAICHPNNSREVLQVLHGFVSNPNDLPPAQLNSDSDYDYLILTIEEFLDDYQPLVDFYMTQGIKTKIFALNAIEMDYTGQDTPEIIRNFIINQYQNYHIQYVLLAGDADDLRGSVPQIPSRKLYGAVESSQVYEDNIPSDLYYAALDGNWNANDNEKWGEPGEEDFLPELYIGRICADNSEEIKNVIQKTIYFQQYPVADDATKILMLGEYLYNDPLSYGSDYLELLIEHSELNGYTTWGFPSSYSYTKLYDKENNWSAEDLISAMNNGACFINHDGHSNYSGAMRLSLYSMSDTTFADLDGLKHLNPVIYSYGCNAAGIDWTNSNGQDCIAEELVSFPNAAVAFVGNTRYGWFNEGQTEGPSLHLHREFVNALFNPEFGTSYTRIGAAHTISRIRSAPFATLPDEFEPGALRWCIYGCSVLGDPALDLWTGKIQQFTAVSFPDSISSATQTITVETGESNAQISLSNENNLLLSETSDGNGSVYFNLPLLNKFQELTLKITKHNFFPFEGKIKISDSPFAKIEDSPGASRRFLVHEIYPNPFNSSGKISFELPAEDFVEITVFDVTGRKIDEIFSGVLSEGEQSIIWKAQNSQNSTIASGIYFIRLKYRNQVQVKHCLYLK